MQGFSTLIREIFAMRHGNLELGNLLGIIYSCKHKIFYLVIIIWPVADTLPNTGGKAANFSYVHGWKYL